MNTTWLRSGTLALALGFGGLTSGHANAQGNLPDAVETRDGSVIRGTIVERRPDGTVLLMDYAGTVREFAADDVVRAGPATAPAAEPTEVTTPPALGSAGVRDMIRLEIIADDERIVTHRQLAVGTGVAFDFRTGSTITSRSVAEEELCEGSCVVALPPGLHVLRMRQHRWMPNYRSAPERFVLEEDTRMMLATRSRRGIRVGSGVATIPLLGFGLYAVATAPTDANGEIELDTMAVLGLISLTAGIVTATMAFLVPDVIDVYVEPLQP